MTEVKTDPVLLFNFLEDYVSVFTMDNHDTAGMVRGILYEFVEKSRHEYDKLLMTDKVVVDE